MSDKNNRFPTRDGYSPSSGKPNNPHPGAGYQPEKSRGTNPSNPQPTSPPKKP
ncbi:hypothetical protein ACWPO9_03720 [Acinetobacter nosocomialis]|uniref:hypothetical protein n=1 Tax=Acinetobacter nosocomialis TaxID=106654 RepID=UPI000A7E9687|nr:hypothetical protein [Acinetobacter nosocomialis]MBD0443599.1 hypothetical protein [Acinetobacter nosocomialis]MBP1502826.1 hypothetical protein [Acinetobacter nosocomialis]MBR7688215.1 hypothetical protein [Acinetobacter nosocomialis]MBR7702930.1 hypothetical protein [Acinetobacter nosocomialis]MBR7762045.1 hypothetical protein [Acinetobacter nosocomialis]